MNITMNMVVIQQYLSVNNSRCFAHQAILRCNSEKCAYFQPSCYNFYLGAYQLSLLWDST